MKSPPVNDPAVRAVIRFKELPTFLRWSFMLQALGPAMVIVSIIAFFIVIVVAVIIQNSGLHGGDRILDTFGSITVLLFYLGIALGLVPAPIHACASAVLARRLWDDHEARALLVLVLIVEMVVTMVLIAVMADAFFYWRHPEYLDSSLWPGSGIFTPEKDRF